MCSNAAKYSPAPSVAWRSRASPSIPDYDALEVTTSVTRARARKPAIYQDRAISTYASTSRKPPSSATACGIPSIPDPTKNRLAGLVSNQGSIGLRSGPLAEDLIRTAIKTPPTRRSAKLRFPTAGPPISICHVGIGAVCVRSRRWTDLLCPKTRRAPHNREAIVCHRPPTSFAWVAQDKRFRPRPRIESRHRCKTSEHRSYLHGSTGKTHVPRRC